MADHVVVMPRYGVPPDIQYYLDCSVECFHLPPDVYFWTRNFCTTITGLIDGFDRDPTLAAADGRHMDYLKRCGLRLEQLYLEWQQTATWAERVLCLGYGVANEPTPARVIASAAHGLVDHLVEDSRLGMGVLYEMPNYNRDVIAYEDQHKRVYSARAKLHREDTYLNSLRRMYQQWNDLDPRPDFSQFRVEWPEQLTRAQMRAAIADMPYEDGIQLIEEETRQARAAHGRLRAVPVVARETRKALVRSSNLLDAVAGSGTTRLFMSGKELRVTGQQYEFVLTKSRHGRIDQSHGACTTEVRSASTGERIAKLCVYTKNVTVFDHLASIVMHCKSGQEHLVLEESNVIQTFNEQLLPESKRFPRRANGAIGLNDLAEQWGINITEAPLMIRSRVDRARDRMHAQAQRKLLSYCYGHLNMPRVSVDNGIRRLIGNFYGPELVGVG